MFIKRIALLTMNWVEQSITDKSTEFLLILAVLMLLGILRQTDGQRLSLFIRSFINPSLLDQQVREERAFNKLAIPLFFAVLSTLSIFLSLSLERLGLLKELEFIFSFAVVAMLILALTLLRGLFYLFLAYLFDLRKVLQAHASIWLLNNFILALLILPLTIIISFGSQPFSKELSLFGIALFFTFYLIRSIRLFTLTQRENHVPLLYNVLYLCALEIMPPIIIGVAILRQAG